MPKTQNAVAEDVTQLPFEDALRELAEVVDLLEAGQISLEESLRLVERGVALADVCDQTLSRAEATLEQLVPNEDGELVAHRLSWGDDADDEGEEDSDSDE
jgi:exodeoxyribonuclease VII small subunit